MHGPSLKYKAKEKLPYNMDGVGGGVPGTTRYRSPENVRMYKYPSGPVSMSVIPPENPLPNITAFSSSLLFATKSSKPGIPPRSSPLLLPLMVKKYKLPLLISPTNMLYAYSSPRLVELNISISVTPSDLSQLKTGSA